MNDIERELRERLQAIAGEVPVGEVPDRTRRREPRTNRMPLVAAAVATTAVVVVIATALLTDDDESRVDVVDAPGTTATGLVPTSCTDYAFGPTLLTGEDSAGPWEFAATGDTPTINLAIHFSATATRPESTAAGSYTQESWTNLVERGDLGLFETHTANADEAMLYGALPAQTRAVRIQYDDGRVEESCTRGRRLGLPVVFFVTQLDRADQPRSMTAVDAAGNTLVTGVVQLGNDNSDEEAPVWIDLQLDRELVALPLEPDPIEWVPAVVGLRLVDARRVLTEHGLDGSVYERDPAFGAAIVIAQEPGPGVEVTDWSNGVGLRTVVPDPPADLECEGYQHPHEPGSADGLPTAEQVSRAAAELVAFDLQDDRNDDVYLAKWERWVWQTTDGEIEVVPFAGFQVVIVANEHDCGPVVPQFINGVPLTEVRGPLDAFAEALAEATPPRGTDLTPDQVEELCEQVERQGQLRAPDTTDEEALAALVAALPSAYRTDAALFYYPYGGDIPPGTDTSGIAATAAGARLYELYSRLCGYTGP